MSARTWLVVGATGVLVAAAGAWVVTSRDDDGDPVPPSPLFGAVEQLTLTPLPEGWGRCAGGPSDRDDATDQWWAQEFGPVVDGECRPLVTVTQIPSGDDVRLPRDATNSGIGEDPDRTGAKRWSDAEAGSRGLYTTGSGGLQLLVVEGCCGEALDDDDFEQVAVAARDATREQEPERCAEGYSDLDQESFLTNFFARRQRALDEDGCPVRGDIVSWRTEAPTAHCFAGVTFLVVGTPVGAAFDTDDPTARLYTRDAEGALDAGDAVNPPPDLDAEVPALAVDSGFRLGGAALWVDPTDDAFVYVVDGETTEAWPRDRRPHGCA